MTLRSKLVSGGIALVLVPVLFIGFFSINRTTTALETTVKQQVAATAKTLSDMIHIAISEEIKLMSGLLARRNIIELASAVAEKGIPNAASEIAQLDEELTDFVKQVGKDYDTIFIVDAEGRVHSSGTSGKRMDIVIADRDYFLGAKAGKLTIGTVIKSKKSGDTVVPIGAPLRSKSGALVGVLAVNIKTDFFSQSISETKIGETGLCTVMDQRGIAIAHPNKALILELDVTKTPGMEQIARNIQKRQPGVETYAFEGVTKLAGYAPVPLTGWTVMASVPVRELFAPVYTLRNTLLLSGCLFLVVAVVLVFLFARRLTKPIMRVVEGLGESTDQVASASDEVASASQHLARVSSEQAAAIEETSSSLEEVSAMTRRNMENANRTNVSMQGVAKVIDEAKNSMTELTTSMEEISKASEDTRKIIKTIDEIAFQTNLLALNAAVEAARAGEAGAGFAVVADEVRNLAMRAADAAKNTANLIDGTVKKIKGGSEIVSRAGNAFANVADASKQVENLVSEIVAASGEQAQKIEQVNGAMAGMDKMTQENAANSEESASAAEEMNAQTKHMKEYVADLIGLVEGIKKSKEPGEAVHTRRTVSARVKNAPHPKRALPGKTPASRKDRAREVPPETLIPFDEDANSF